jgi:alpha-methylacyl-CoA racemase
VTQAAPAPRVSRSQPAVPTPAVRPGTHTDAILADAGFSAAEIAALRAAGAASGA